MPVLLPTDFFRPVAPRDRPLDDSGSGCGLSIAKRVVPLVRFCKDGADARGLAVKRRAWGNKRGPNCESASAYPRHRHCLDRSTRDFLYQHVSGDATTLCRTCCCVAPPRPSRCSIWSGLFLGAQPVTKAEAAVEEKESWGVSQPLWCGRLRSETISHLPQQKMYCSTLPLTRPAPRRLSERLQ